MKTPPAFTEERILVCVYYGPTGEQLIHRGGNMAARLQCPLYVMTIDSRPYDELDAERTDYLLRWQELAEQYDVDEYIVKTNEVRPVAKVIAEVAREYEITQIFIGQTAQSRWQEIAKGSIVNVLLREIPCADLHIISVARYLENEDSYFQKGVRAYLVKDGEAYRLCFNRGKNTIHEGIFFKETGTDFNNGIFRYRNDNQLMHLHITDDYVTELKNVRITGPGSECETWDKND